MNLSEGLTKMGSHTFLNCDALTSITIPATLTAADAPFNGCDNLKTAVIAEGATVIPNSLFQYCAALESVTLPDSVTDIGQRAFEGCTSLASISIPEAVTVIRSWAFKDCTSLTSISIPAAMAEFGGYVFENCSALETVNLSEGLTKMGSNTFRNCSGLTSITIPKNLESVSNSNEGGPFNGCVNLKTAVLEEGMTKIPDYLFRWCFDLESVAIPDSVTEIGTCAFQSCHALASVTLPSSLTKLGSKAFQDCSSLTSVTIPKTLQSVSHSGDGGPFSSCDNLTTAVLEEGMTTLPAYLFLQCTTLETVTIPDTVTLIGAEVFNGCSNLKNIVIPNAVTELGYALFKNCTALESIVLPDSVESMYTEIFSGCTALKEVTLPSIRVNIMARTFEGCTALERIVLPDTVTTVQDHAFKNCTSLAEVVWSSSLIEIQQYAFENCDALETAILPEGTQTIGEGAFYDSDALTTVSIPDTVTSMGTKIFYDCDALTDVDWGAGYASIPDSTFEHCDALPSLVVPAGVTAIRNNAFKNCVDFTSITLPRSMAEIADSAFSYPGKMTIYGLTGTYAETYAREKGITFVNQDVHATSVTLSETNLTLYTGATVQLTVSVAPENCTELLTWSSSDESVATVSEDGLITAVGMGSTKIEVTTGTMTASCNVTVLQGVTSIVLNQGSASLADMETLQLIATVYPEEANNKAVVWESSDSTIATVDENGLVTAVSKGSATITATAADGSGVTATCWITVTNNGYIVTDPAELESPHDYPNNCRDFWQYTLEGASQLVITFDSRTLFEYGYDVLYVYYLENGEFVEYDSFTGSQLAGVTLEIPGDTVKLLLHSDSSQASWGFKVVSVTAHQHTFTVVTEEPTCTEDGYTTSTCSCGYSETQTLPATGHNYETVVTEAGCVMGGYTTHTCVCGDSYVTDETPALGHDLGDWLPVGDGACTMEHDERRECSRCDFNETRRVPASGHQYEDVVVPPTCIDHGYTTHTCTVCGHAFIDSFVPTVDHSWDEGVQTGDVITYTCTVCEETRTEQVAAPDCPFTDVSTDAYFFEPVLWAVENGITSGTSATTFAPNATCTRAQVVTFLWRAMGSPEPASAENPFSDVNAADYFYKAVLWAVENGITSGTGGGKFSPNSPCTRSQVVTFLWRTMGQPAPQRTDNPFTDVAEGIYYYQPVLWAVENGITSGTSATTFAPSNPCTRAQVVTFLFRALKN